MTELTDEAVKTLAEADAGKLFADQDEDICIDDGRAKNLVFCPARDDAVIPGDWPVLNPDVVAEIVARYNVAPALARALARALLDARAERDRLRADAQAANGVWQANLRLQAELAAAQTQLGDWIVRADGANVMAEKAEAELAAAQQREARLREALTLIERVYYLEEKDAAWKIARMNGIAREAQDGNDLTHYRRIFPRAALSNNGRGE